MACLMSPVRSKNFGLVEAAGAARFGSDTIRAAAYGFKGYRDSWVCCQSLSASGIGSILISCHQAASSPFR